MYGGICIREKLQHNFFQIFKFFFTSSSSATMPSRSSSERGPSNSAECEICLMSIIGEEIPSLTYKWGYGESPWWWNPDPLCHRAWRSPSAPSAWSPCRGPRRGRWRTAGRTPQTQSHQSRPRPPVTTVIISLKGKSITSSNRSFSSSSVGRNPIALCCKVEFHNV